MIISKFTMQIKNYVTILAFFLKHFLVNLTTGTK